jgi:hypothetical protein
MNYGICIGLRVGELLVASRIAHGEINSTQDLFNPLLGVFLSLSPKGINSKLWRFSTQGLSNERCAVSV